MPRRLLLVEHLLIQPNDRFAIMPIFVYQRPRTAIHSMPGTSGSRSARGRRCSSRNTSRWRSKRASTRPSSPSGHYDGWLRKFTIAPQIGAGRKFFSRPVLRTFLTYANWSDAFRGLVGGTPYLKKNERLDLRSAGGDMVVGEGRKIWPVREISSTKLTPRRCRRISAETNYSRPLAIVTTLFFMWGFLTCLNDILVPHLKSIFDLSYARVMLIQFAFFSAYFLFSLPWSRIVNTIGYQRTMVAGLLTMAAGAFLFIPAAVVVSFPLFLTALMVLAAGITGLQVAANPYVVVLGKPETASSRLDLTQAFNSLGTTIAPKLGGLLILSVAPLAMEQLRQLTPQALAGVSRVRSGIRKAALCGDRRSVVGAGHRDRRIEAAEDRTRGASVRESG